MGYVGLKLKRSIVYHYNSNLRKLKFVNSCKFYHQLESCFQAKRENMETNQTHDLDQTGKSCQLLLLLLLLLLFFDNFN